jgi:hypothetical protein
MHVLDRIVRFALAAAVTALVFGGTLTGVAGALLGAISIAFLATSLFGICPLYTVLRLSSRAPWGRKGTV